MHTTLTFRRNVENVAGVMKKSADFEGKVSE